MFCVGTYNLKAIAEGWLSYIPGSTRLFRKGTRGTDSARYCYSVWLRHLVKIHAYRRVPLDGVVVELGPGDSLGTGLASLLSGASKYFAIDVVRHSNVEHNLRVFEELIRLFETRAPIPSDAEFQGIKPQLDDLRFPRDILRDDWMAHCLNPRRLKAISDALAEVAEGESPVNCVDPLKARTLIGSDRIDLLFSQAVLEHADNLSNVYEACFAWLKRDGVMSHQIDFKSHGLSPHWNGHWVYPEPVWRLIRGKRPYLLNREPCSTHFRMLSQTGFEVIAEERSVAPTRLARSQLASRYRGLSDDDLTTAGVFLVAQKRRA